MTPQGAHEYTPSALTPDQLREQVARTRQELGRTVGELAARADVKAMARQQAEEAGARMRHAVDHTRAEAMKKATGVSGAVRNHKVPVLGAIGVAAVVAAWIAMGCNRRKA
jgi:hypothetical protein